MEIEKETRICKSKIRNDLQSGRVLDSGGAYLTALSDVAQNTAEGKYDCPPHCPGLRSEPRRIGGFVLPIFPREI